MNLVLYMGQLGLVHFTETDEYYISLWHADYRHFREFYSKKSRTLLFHGTRALSQNVTNVPKGALTPNLKNVEVTVQNKLHYCKILRSKLKYENHPRAITPKVWCLELWFLCTALLPNLNEIFLPSMKLQSFKVMRRTKKGQTNGRTDERIINYYMPPFGGINSIIYSLNQNKMLQCSGAYNSGMCCLLGHIRTRAHLYALPNWWGYKYTII